MIEEQPARRDNRRVLLAGAGVAGVLLGLLLLVTVFSGDGDDVAVGNPPASARATAPASTTTVPVAPADDTTTVLAGARDPFHQIVTVPEAGPTAQAAQLPQAAPPPQPPPTTAPVPPPPAPEPPPAAAPQPAQAPPPAQAPASPEPAPVPSPAGPPPAAQSGPTAGGPGQGDYAVLELLSISRDGAGVERAHLTVDGHYYSPAEGEVFSYGLRFDIQGNCVEVSAPDGARVKLCLPPGAGG